MAIGEIIYTHNGYVEVVIREFHDVRLVQCLDKQDTKLYRIEFPTGARNTARYTLQDAIACYLSHAYKGFMYVVTAYSTFDTKIVECPVGTADTVENFRNAVRVGTELLCDKCTNVTIYTWNDTTGQFKIK